MSLSSLNRHGDLAMLVLRLILGVVFLAHGVMKFGAFSQPAEGMNIIMMILAVAEPLGGAALVLGVLTRWAALGLSVVMLGAIYTKQFVWGGAFIHPQFGWEFDLVILGGLLVLLTHGAGRYAVSRS